MAHIGLVVDLDKGAEESRTDALKALMEGESEEWMENCAIAVARQLVGQFLEQNDLFNAHLVAEATLKVDSHYTATEVFGQATAVLLHLGDDDD